MQTKEKERRFNDILQARRRAKSFSVEAILKYCETSSRELVEEYLTTLYPAKEEIWPKSSPKFKKEIFGLTFYFYRNTARKSEKYRVSVYCEELREGMVLWRDADYQKWSLTDAGLTDGKTWYTYGRNGLNAICKHVGKTEKEIEYTIGAEYMRGAA